MSKHPFHERKLQDDLDEFRAANASLAALVVQYEAALRYALAFIVDTQGDSDPTAEYLRGVLGIGKIEVL